MKPVSNESLASMQTHVNTHTRMLKMPKAHKNYSSENICKSAVLIQFMNSPKGTLSKPLTESESSLAALSSTHSFWNVQVNI